MKSAPWPRADGVDLQRPCSQQPLFFPNTRTTHALDPDVLDLVPSDPALTAYDEQYAITYLRMLDADAEGADWREFARIVPRFEPDREPDRARQVFENHLARAKWAARHGYRHLLHGAGRAQLMHGADKPRWPRRKSKL